VWLYIDDKKNRNSILDRVDKGDNLEDLITSPVQADRKEINREHFVDGAIVDDMDKDKLQIYHES